MQVEQVSGRMNGSDSVSLDTLPDVLNVEEVAKVIRLNKNAVYDLLRQGVIKSIRVGRRLLVPKQVLINWLNNAE